MSLVKEAVLLRLLGAIKVHALHFATTITYMAYNIWHIWRIVKCCYFLPIL